MKRAHSIVFSVFCKPEEDLESLETALLTLFPFSLEEEKIKLKKTTASIFEERKITILTITLEKERHTSQFLDVFIADLSPEQKHLLFSQENRLDDECQFFIRLDKDALLDGKLLLTDSGHCVHIRITIAAFPKKRDAALLVVQSLFGDS